jgi:uncharacterized membrane protein YjjP (DUF1212 family)
LSERSNNRLSAQETTEALKVIARIGVLALQSGSASFRAKEMMHRVATGLGLEQVGIIVTPSVILTTAPGEYGSYTQVLKVPALGVNMARITALDALSHRISGTPSPVQVSALLDVIQDAKAVYPPAVVIGCVAAACGAFAFILGGGLPEFLAAAVGAAVAQAIRFRMAAISLNPYLITAVGATVATAFSYILVRVLAAPSPQLGLIASVLLLVPGTPLVTSLLDLIHLDLISGVTRGAYAVLLVANIAIGMLLVLALTGFSI